MIKVYALDFSNWYEFLMSFSTVASLIMIIVTPIIMYRFLRRNNDKLETEEFVTTYGALTDDLRTQNKSALLYQPIFTLRRLAFAVIIVVVYFYNWL